MDVLHALVLSVVQGVTEFLPVSSSAHLYITAIVFGYDGHSVGFDIAVHFATLIAVFVYFRSDIVRYAAGYLAGDRSARSFVNALIIATVPIVLFGSVLYRNFEMLQYTVIIGGALIASGALLFMIDWCIQRRKIVFEIPMHRRGLVIGMFQTLALIPGVSRSGITIAGARLVGFSRTEATRFSFLLSIPTITGALVLLIGDTSSGVFLSDAGFFIEPTVLLGMGVAFLVAYSVIRLFISLVERIGFGWFFIYQVLLGVTLLCL